MCKLVKFVAIAFVLLVLCAPVAVFAQDAVTTDSAAVASAALDLKPIYGLGAGLVMIGAALGIGKIGASAVESIARQPETASKVQTAMIIAAALIEGATFFALVICFLAK